MKPRIIAYMVAHYGVDFIPYAIQSVYNQIDEIHIVYTPHPSHGYQTSVSPIETKEQVQDAVFTRAPNDKVHWHISFQAYREGDHRDLAVRLCVDAGADMILVVDCDEVWHDEVLKSALDYAWQKNEARNWLINFTHLWRSFNWCCRDEGWPVRIIDLRHSDRNSVAYIPREIGEIYHFGYAVKDEIMAYKWKIHGHKDELRLGWLQNQWNAWPPVEDCHPTNGKNEAGKGFWNPELFDKVRLPSLMRSHSFWNEERIE